MYSEPTTCTLHVQSASYMCTVSQLHVHLHTVCKPLYMYNVHTGSQLHVLYLWLHVHTFVHCTLCWLPACIQTSIQYAGYMYMYIYIQYVGYMCIQYVSYMYIQMYNMQATCTCSYTMQATYTCIHTCTGSQLHVLYIWLHVHTLYTMLASCIYTVYIQEASIQYAGYMYLQMYMYNMQATYTYRKPATCTYNM